MDTEIQYQYPPAPTDAEKETFLQQMKDNGATEECLTYIQRCLNEGMYPEDILDCLWTSSMKRPTAGKPPLFKPR